MTTRTRAIALALFVTVLWSSSWVLIKLGLRDLDLKPISFAGIRYTIAAATLLCVAWPALGRLRHADSLRPQLFGHVAVFGLLLYGVTQGAQFVALGLLPNATVSLVMNNTSIIVAFVSAWALREAPTRLQVAGIAVIAAGALMYFGRAELGTEATVGLGFAALATLTNGIGTVLNRSLAREAMARLGGPLPLTAMSMTVGAVALLTTGIVVEGVPLLTPLAWGIVIWLAVVNTAVAYTLWSWAMKMLTAPEASVINNTMLIQIAVLAWIFLGEALNLRQLAGLACVAVGVLLVQVAPGLEALAHRRWISAAGRLSAPLPTER